MTEGDRMTAVAMILMCFTLGLTVGFAWLFYVLEKWLGDQDGSS